MKRGSIIVGVGDELLAGRTVDTNAHFLSGVLRRAGFPTKRRVVVGDEPAAIAEAVRAARREAAVVVVTGGLGPTKDDLTRDGLAKAFGVALRRDGAAEKMLVDAYGKRGRAVPEGSLVQADFPAGCVAVQNPRGTAPGILLSDDDGLLLAAPGVPAELEGMVVEELLPLLSARPERGPSPRLVEVTIAGLAEATVGRVVADLMERGRDPTVGSYPKSGRVVLALESERPAAEADRLLAADVETIRSRVGSAFVGVGDLRLNEVVVRELRARKKTIAVAESLTGGLVADGVVEIPGASDVFIAGIAAYADAAKRTLLDVPDRVLEGDGAVSEACARAMAEGARRRTGADCALSTTGIAGPSGGSEEKPVGTVWFAIADAAGTITSKRVFPGGRAEIRGYARERAFDLLRRRLLGYEPESSLDVGAPSKSS